MSIELAPNGLPQSSQWLFPEYDFAQMTPDEFVGVIIERILDRGSWHEVNWLFERYGERCLTEWVRQHGFRLLSPRSFALWRLNLGITDFIAPDWAREAKAMIW
jgi:hypothetical protein